MKFPYRSASSENIRVELIAPLPETWLKFPRFHCLLSPALRSYSTSGPNLVPRASTTRDRSTSPMNYIRFYYLSRWLRTSIGMSELLMENVICRKPDRRIVR